MSLMKNISSLSVDKLVEEMSAVYVTAVKSDLSGKTIPAVMLYGAPGVGKSSSVRQIAERVARETDKEVEVVDIRLSIMNPVDILGLPVADTKRNEAKYLVPKMFNLEDVTDKYYIVFFDELNTCTPSMQAAAYQLILDRRCGGFELPQNCFVIAAGNRKGDRSISHNLSAALLNRMVHIEVESSFESWRRYAVASGFSPYVVGYLDFDQSKLFYEAADREADEVAFVSPRTWQFTSDMLNVMNATPRELHHFIAGSVGLDVALAFEKWCDIFSKLPDLDLILNGSADNVVLPRGQDVLYALINALSNRIIKDEMYISDAQIEHAIKWVALKLPKDFAAKFMFDLQSVEAIKSRISSMTCYIEWFKKNRAKL